MQGWGGGVVRGEGRAKGGSVCKEGEGACKEGRGCAMVVMDRACESGGVCKEGEGVCKGGG